MFTPSPLPTAAVPVTSILSKWDGIVHWKASVAPRRERTESIEVPASHVTADFDWWAIGERLAGVVGEPLVEGQLSASLRSP